jgi:hypothetical protein
VPLIFFRTARSDGSELIYALSQERPAESSMSSQDSDPFSEISKIISTSQDDGLAKQATNCHAFPQKRFAIAGTSSQDSDPSVRKKIKRTNDADSKKACMMFDEGRLEINGRIIILGSKETVFVKLLFDLEKVHRYLQLDLLNHRIEEL